MSIINVSKIVASFVREGAALTLVDAEAVSGANKIHEIDLGGTTTKLMFQ
jgi:hypothetical protein